jgi:hypothetical protein
VPGSVAMLVGLLGAWRIQSARDKTVR